MVFFVAGLAELNRPPFDMPVADAEIIFGPLTEYTGLRFALFLLAEYAGIVVSVLPDRGAVPRRLARPLRRLVALDAAQGWRPGLRGDLAAGQLSAAARGPAAALAWQGLIPVALVQLLLTGVVVVAW